MKQRTRGWKVAGALAALALVSLGWGPRPAAAAGSPSIAVAMRYLEKGPVPVPRIPGPTWVRIPVYSGSTLVRGRLDGSQETPMPGTPYLEGGGKVYQVPAGAQALMAWYRRAMGARGWSVNETGSSGGHRGVLSYQLGFGPKHRTGVAHPEEIYLTFSAGKPPVTLVIWATRIMTPARPAWNDVPKNVSRITGYVKTLNPARTTAVDITGAAQIAPFVTAINGLKHVMAGDYGCPDITETARLVLAVPGKPSRVVRWSACGTEVGSIPLNTSPALTGLMERLAGQAPH